MRQRRLFDGQERTDFVSARTDHANCPRDDQKEQIPRRSERHACPGHENRAGEERAPSPHPVGTRGEQEGHRDIARKRQRHQHSYLRFRVAETHQVEHEDNRQRSVRKEPDKARKEQHYRVPWQHAERNRKKVQQWHLNLCPIGLLFPIFPFD